MEFVNTHWYLLCWAAKWLNEKEIYRDALPYHKGYKKDKENDYEIVLKLWKLLDKADIVIAHNAVKFDVKKINACFIKHGLTPPSPYKVIDTLLEARKNFSIMSNRLNDLGVFLKVGKKMKTGGFQLWRDCLNGDERAWNKMVRYCVNDVKLLERIYKKILPYIRRHPNLSIGSNGKCPKCGSKMLIKRGLMTTLTNVLQRYSCKKCGGWCSKRDRLLTKDEKLEVYKNL